MNANTCAEPGLERGDGSTAACTPAAAATSSWQEGPFELVYRLGSVPLFRRRLSALHLRGHFLDLPADPAESRPPLGRLGGGVDVIVAPSHPIREPLPRLTTVDGALRYVVAQYSRHHAELSGSLDEYLAKFGGKSRNTLKRKVRKFLDLGGGSGMREYHGPKEIVEFHRRARAVSALTYQERLLDAGLPADPGFLDELVALARADSVRAYVLFLRDEPIAYLCCPAVDGVLLYDYLGYDPRHADLSPGTVLQYLAFEALFREQRFRAFDFTEGEGAHKRLFGTHETLCADICFFPQSASVRFWLGLHAGLDRISVRAAEGLDRLGLKSALKRLMRRA